MAAKNDLMTNIQQVADDFYNIKQAIINKGVEVPNETKTSEYGSLINNIITTLDKKVLFEGFEDTYTLLDGFTGFSPLYSDGVVAGGDTDIVQSNGLGVTEKYGQKLAKAWSISGAEAQYTDSAVLCSNEEIDLTNYNMICCEFYGYCDQSKNYITLQDRELMASYFKIDKPTSLPQSNIQYDWSEWDNVNMTCYQNGKYYFDISNITGSHFICFGAWHGAYEVGYSNGIKIYKLFLI